MVGKEYGQGQGQEQTKRVSHFLINLQRALGHEKVSDIILLAAFLSVLQFIRAYVGLVGCV